MIYDATVVFIAQYCYVLLLGLQSLNVRDQRYVSAAITSFLLGVGGFFITSIVGAAKGLELSILWWCFVLSGPCGIVTAMRIHPWMSKVFSSTQERKP